MTVPPNHSSARSPRGIAGLFDDAERKELFRKYLYFLGWVEILILIASYLYQLGDGRYDVSSAVEAGFPWRTYFYIAFITPVAITFLVGMVIVGFNKYFAEVDPNLQEPSAAVEDQPRPEAVSRMRKLQRMVVWVQRLPFLGLLLLLGVGSIFFYKLDGILAFLSNVGEKSIKVLLVTGAVLLVLASLFAFLLIVLNYQLRKKTMAYQYRSEMAERFGLIILDDNSVINSDGKLLIQGRGMKKSLPLLPEKTSEAMSEPRTATVRPQVDPEPT
jgi:hypothetical protein